MTRDIGGQPLNRKKAYNIHDSSDEREQRCNPQVMNESSCLSLVSEHLRIWAKLKIQIYFRTQHLSVALSIIRPATSSWVKVLSHCGFSIKPNATAAWQKSSHDNLAVRGKTRSCRHDNPLTPALQNQLASIFQSEL